MTDPVSAVRSSESSLHAKVDMVMQLCAEQRDDNRTFAIHLRDQSTAIHDQYAALRADLAKTMVHVEEHTSDVAALTEGIHSLSAVVRGLERVEQSRAERTRLAKTLVSWGAAALGLVSTAAGLLAALGLR